MDERQAIIDEALKWIGTPFHNQAQILGQGVDCAMLVHAVYAACGYCPRDYKPARYSAQWALHNSRELFIETMLELGAVEVPQGKPGDIIMYKHGRCFSHGGIIVDDNYLIHAYQVERAVTLTERNNSSLCMFRNGSPRPVRYFSVIGGPR